MIPLWQRAADSLCGGHTLALRQVYERGRDAEPSYKGDLPRICARLEQCGHPDLADEVREVEKSLCR